MTKLKMIFLSRLARASQYIASGAQWIADQVAHASARIERLSHDAEVNYVVAAAMARIADEEKRQKEEVEHAA